MTLKILVVEDDPRIADVIAKNLEAVGYACTRAADGGQALVPFGRVHPALVVWTGSK
jgi:DNA-binding response OmpR family regulator